MPAVIGANIGTFVMRRGRRDARHAHVGLATSATSEVHEFDLADAEFDPIESAGLSLLRLSVPARLLMVAAAAALLWSAVFWALA
jgi:hypothetical protein